MAKLILTPREAEIAVLVKEACPVAEWVFEINDVSIHAFESGLVFNVQLNAFGGRVADESFPSWAAFAQAYGVTV